MPVFIEQLDVRILGSALPSDSETCLEPCLTLDEAFLKNSLFLLQGCDYTSAAILFWHGIF